MDPEPTSYASESTGTSAPQILSAFPGLTSSCRDEYTVLTGRLDRYGFYGVLAEIEALGLDLLEVRQLGPHGECPDDGTPLP